MQKLKLFISVYLLIVSSAATIAQTNIDKNVVSQYTIDVSLDIENKQIIGQTILSWENPSDDLITEMYFHLYYNGFRNTESTFFKDDGGIPDFLSTQIDEVCGWGWSNITNITDESGNDLTHTLTYVQTDDNNSDDMSVAKIKLSNAIAARATTVLTIKWKAKIPNTMPRTGYNKDFYFFAQWFPKLGVYEPAGMRGTKIGKWNCHQYHATGEYYSDFSNYDVKMSVPHDFKVASSGQLKNKTKQDSFTTWNFQVDKVIDFTWSASPHFISKTEKHKSTDIHFYTYPYKEHVSDRYFKTLHFIMDFLEDHLGPYPYPTLTIIDPPIHGLYTGGMEYPTLITSISFNFFPPGFRTPETLVTHEFIHQYFMQMIATHEVEEPWMDEGFTTYWESRLLDSLFSPSNSMICLGGLQIGTKEYNRSEFLNSKNPKIASSVTKANEFEFGGYGPIAYNKTALWLQTLEGLIGQDLMDKIWKQYFTSWQYNHPYRQDFIDVVNDLVMQNLSNTFPEGMDWFFEQVLYGTNECDYAVASIALLEQNQKRGFFDDLENCEISEIAPDLTYSYEIVLHRLGEIQVPIEYVINYDDSSTELLTWNGEDRGHKIVLKSTAKIESIEIDPARKIYLDKNFTNNSKRFETNHTSSNQLKSLLISNFQHVLESIALLF